MFDFLTLTVIKFSLYLIIRFLNESIFYFAVDCKWGDWSFGECSKSCGGGIRLDTREKVIKVLNGGKDCSGPSNITENCNIHDCPGDHI